MNYFESEEWRDTKRIIDEKLKLNKVEKRVYKSQKEIYGEGVKVEIDWNLVKLFNRR